MAVHMKRCIDLGLADLICYGDDECLLTDTSEWKDAQPDDALPFATLGTEMIGPIRPALGKDLEHCTLTAAIAAEKSMLTVAAHYDRLESLWAKEIAEDVRFGRTYSIELDLPRYIHAHQMHRALLSAWPSIYDEIRERKAVVRAETANAANAGTSGS